MAVATRIFVVLLLLIAVLVVILVVVVGVSAAHPPSPASPGTPAGTSASAPPGVATAPVAPVAPVDANDPAGEPQGPARLEVLAKPHFTIGYDPTLHEPAWVSYALAGPIRFHGHETRPERFLPDAAVADAPRHEDYNRSGYDRGHMCPAYALFSRYGEAGLAETFITTNICPQVHALNAGRWEDLEALIAGREHARPRHHGHAGHEEEPAAAEPPELAHLLEEGGWAGQYGQVWVTDGPVVSDHATHLRGGEAVPERFYMIILRRDKESHYRSLAFEMPNAGVEEPLEHFLVAISAIERETGLHFLTALPSDQQEALKAEAAPRLW